MLTPLLKQPDEQMLGAARFPRAVAWPGVISIVPRGLVAQVAPLAAGSARIVQSGAAIEVMLSGGTDGERYLVTVAGETEARELLHAEIELLVLDTGWRTPEGGAAWLSIADFVARVGVDEVVRATDPDGSGRIDRDLLENALIDAQAIAESHVAGRYALPLATVPRVLTMAVADLARVRLYPRGAPEAAEKAAALALKSLEAIGAGRASLGIPAAEIPAPPASDAPVVIAPGRRRYPDGLEEY